MKERRASGKGRSVAHDAELDGGLAVAQPARTCRIWPDPVGNGAHAADLEGRRPGRGVRWLAGAAWLKPMGEERDGEKREDGKEMRGQREREERDGEKRDDGKEMRGQREREGSGGHFNGLQRGAAPAAEPARPPRRQVTTPLTALGSPFRPIQSQRLLPTSPNLAPFSTPASTRA